MSSGTTDKSFPFEANDDNGMRFRAGVDGDDIVYQKADGNGWRPVNASEVQYKVRNKARSALFPDNQVQAAE